MPKLNHTKEELFKNSKYDPTAYALAEDIDRCHFQRELFANKIIALCEQNMELSASDIYLLTKKFYYYGDDKSIKRDLVTIDELHKDSKTLKDIYFIMLNVWHPNLDPEPKKEEEYIRRLDELKDARNKIAALKSREKPLHPTIQAHVEVYDQFINELEHELKQVQQIAINSDELQNRNDIQELLILLRSPIVKAKKVVEISKNDLQQTVKSSAQMKLINEALQSPYLAGEKKLTQEKVFSHLELAFKNAEDIISRKLVQLKNDFSVINPPIAQFAGHLNDAKELLELACKHNLLNNEQQALLWSFAVKLQQQAERICEYQAKYIEAHLEYIEREYCKNPIGYSKSQFETAVERNKREVASNFYVIDQLMANLKKLQTIGIPDGSKASSESAESALTQRLSSIHTTIAKLKSAIDNIAKIGEKKEAYMYPEKYSALKALGKKITSPVHSSKSSESKSETKSESKLEKRGRKNKEVISKYLAENLPPKYNYDFLTVANSLATMNSSNIRR